MLETQLKSIGYQNNFLLKQNIKSRQVIKRKIEGNPFISIVIPAYKKLEVLKIVLESVINQKGNYNYEILIVNDYPEDKELEAYLRLLNNEKINYYVNDKNLGLFGNWNRCIELAKGKWISLLNDDDILYSDYVDKVYKILKNNPQIDFLYSAHDIANVRTPGQIQQIVKHDGVVRKVKKSIKGEEERLFQKGPILSKIQLLDFFFEHQITHPLGQLMKKEYLVKLGGYNEKYYPSSDWVLNYNYCLNANLYYYNVKIGCRTEGINVSAKKETKRKFIEVDYGLRLEFSKMLRIPFKKWYTACFMANYAKLINVYQNIQISEIKKCTVKELELQKIIMHLYIKVRTIQNYIESKSFKII